MTKPRSDTRQRIQEVARELFLRHGVQRTSLQDIADELGITKPALYYHFTSREDLVRSIVVPLIEEGERFVADSERVGGVDARELLEGYFDFFYRHRQDLMLVLAEWTTLSDLGLIDTVLAWHERLGRVVFGPKPPLAQATRAVVALGGLQDCCIQFPDAPYEELRARSVDAALAALGVLR
ncbi:TetR/AcrR family transcriptional regulator [Mycobacterium riyadhense]|uniref:TetR family transcriptional regulator n=1 Tax=Mycobacterium riyadhense TaxID=486698 RepID=A0A1X2DCL7_9MYCO|nr:TetR/AcrR family transcriptional regulator [Mycobacterium riyadhense]MCV7146956.1 TetR/AcrR family transcriptional regulator [Mycobacterium riyadhense]ORW85872.1 TetR family transcriptional regulator [Mycobacterium riyadhense]VTO98462.1 HTH-type transcriptional regulator TtgR [Mycobacterium riyadhense]